jgi:hypothetical protein
MIFQNLNLYILFFQKYAGIVKTLDFIIPFSWINFILKCQVCILTPRTSKAYNFLDIAPILMILALMGEYYTLVTFIASCCN